MNDPLVFEKSFHVPKLKLLETFPLYPFLHGKDDLSIVEVGGNIGLWCVAFQEVFGPRVAQYRAYEPMPANAQHFRRRCADYGFDVELFEMCVGDKPGEVEIHYDKDVTALASVVVPYMETAGMVIDNRNSLTVPQTTLDELVTSPVDLVKIDTEGYEWQVIEGGANAIDDGLIDRVYFEFGQHQKHLGQSFQMFEDFFRSRGWSLYRQRIGRNFFGLTRIDGPDPQLAEAKSMWMILATKDGPSPDYRGPTVFR
jgi:FkbM family methyltransferase